MLSGRGLCDELITHPEESFRMWCVPVCDLETSYMRRPWPTGGLSRQKQNKTGGKYNNHWTVAIRKLIYTFTRKLELLIHLSSETAKKRLFPHTLAQLRRTTGVPIPPVNSISKS